jgi:hypothetical protein
MKTGGGTYLTHVLKGTQSEQCHPDRPHHLHYLPALRHLQYTSKNTMRLRELRDSIDANGSAIANMNGHALVVD